MSAERRFGRLWGLPAILAVVATSAAGWSDPSQLCLDAAASAAEATGVPREVLLAVALVETGRDDRPWPWTINVAGDGRWFDTAAEAEAHAQTVLDDGGTNLDVGCFQLNIRWHSKAFTSLADMLDPQRNAGYAAGYLAQHFAETGTWADAAARYHSATPEHAERYRVRFETALASLEGADMPPSPDVLSRQNGFPLLMAGSSGLNGSLVPTTPGGNRLIGGY